MTWSVTYRSEDGRRASVEIEAADRNALFNELKQRGITAISIAEGRIPRKGRSSTAKHSGVNNTLFSRVLLGLIAFAAVVAASICAWFLISSNAGDPTETSTAKKVLPSKPPIEKQKIEISKAPATNIVVETEKPNARLYKGVAVVSSSATTNGVDGAVIERLKLADGRTVKVVSLPKPLFESPSDQLIAMALSSQPGQSVAPMPIDVNVEQAFLDSLMSPIRINDDDPDDVKELKANVLEARAYIADEVKAGKSVREVLEEYQMRMNDIADRHLMAVQELQKIKDEYGVEEAREFAIRVNEAFRARGIPEINVPETEGE